MHRKSPVSSLRQVSKPLTMASNSLLALELLSFFALSSYGSSPCSSDIYRALLPLSTYPTTPYCASTSSATTAAPTHQFDICYGVDGVAIQVVNQAPPTFQYIEDTTAVESLDDCDQSAECFAFTWDPTSLQCILFNSGTGHYQQVYKFISPAAGGVSGQVLFESCPKPAANPQMHLRVGRRTVLWAVDFDTGSVIELASNDAIRVVVTLQRTFIQDSIAFTTSLHFPQTPHASQHHF